MVKKKKRGRPPGSKNKKRKGSTKQAIKFKTITSSFDLRLENAVSVLEAAIEDTINRLKGNVE